MIVEYRKVRCDECGKEEIIQDSGLLPLGCLAINIHEAYGTIAHPVLEKEVCSRKCAIKLMNETKKLPKQSFRM